MFPVIPLLISVESFDAGIHAIVWSGATLGIFSQLKFHLNLHCVLSLLFSLWVIKHFPYPQVVRERAHSELVLVSVYILFGVTGDCKLVSQLPKPK